MWPESSLCILRSSKRTDLPSLLDYIISKKKLSISQSGLSYYLQNGLVPYPNTIFQDVLIVGIGDKLDVREVDGSLFFEFVHKYPFLHHKKTEEVEVTNSELVKIVKCVVEKMVKDKTFLFHSAGKDSNLILASLTDSDFKENVTLVTHRSKGQNDETEICSNLANKYGFKQVILDEVDRVTDEDRNNVIEFFKNLPLPMTDNVSLAYPLYTKRFPDLKSANLMTGDGNDFYMGTPPSKKDLMKYKASAQLSRLRKYQVIKKSESIYSYFLRTAPEWNWMEGFSTYEADKLTNHFLDVSKHWRGEVEKRAGWPEIDFKTDLYCSSVVQQVHVQKFRLAAYSWGSKANLPLMDSSIAKTFWSLPERFLHDGNGKNKVIIREILKEKIGLDSDMVGKKGYNFDSATVVENNWNWVREEILSCDQWNRFEVEKILKRLKRNLGGGSISNRLGIRLIYRLFLLSLWFNHSKYYRGVTG